MSISIDLSINALLHVFTINFFTDSVVNVWNYLPNTVDFNSFAVFKRTVTRVNFSSHLRFSWLSQICQ